MLIIDDCPQMYSALIQTKEPFKRAVFMVGCLLNTLFVWGGASGAPMSNAEVTSHSDCLVLGLHF